MKEGVYRTGGTTNCSPCVKGGYRDTRIHGFQTTNSHKGKFQWDTEGQKFRSSSESSGMSCPGLWILHPFKTPPNKA